jgi:hypothetical protein
MQDITVVIPTSPIPAHPSTEIIERTIESIRKHLPDAPIKILCDGVRPEVEHRREAYREYIERLLKLAVSKYELVLIFPFATHLQQAGMLNAAMDWLKTPFLLFCEHDCILDDKPIGWNAIKKVLESGSADLVRLYWHQCPHPEHLHLMQEEFSIDDEQFIRTTQYSGWPHIAKVDLYRSLFAENAFGDCRTMLETPLYSVFLSRPGSMCIYLGKGKDDAVRFHHLDARTDHDTGLKDKADW